MPLHIHVTSKQIFKYDFILLESAVSNERAEEMKSWMKFNQAPQKQVENYMLETVAPRAKWIQNNPALTIFQIAQEYPRLLDRPGMVGETI